MRGIMSMIVQFMIGLLFGVGLLLSGMSNPAKVQNFLDFAAIPAGGWDPSLAFVMAGAIAIALPGYRWATRRAAPLLADRFQLPATTGLDARLILGAAIFGVGWGLAGFCPGPGFTALGFGGAAAPTFVIAMLAGMFVARLAARSRT